MRPPPRTVALAAIAAGLLLLTIPAVHHHRGTGPAKIPPAGPAPAGPSPAPAGLSPAPAAAAAATAFVIGRFHGAQGTAAAVGRRAPAAPAAQLPPPDPGSPAETGQRQQLQIVATAVHLGGTGDATVLLTAQLSAIPKSGAGPGMVVAVALTVRLTRTAAGWRVPAVEP